MYFIYVNYDIGYVQFFKVKNLYNINKVYEIQFDSTHENTVQFIDNLILIHDFETMISRIIDLKCSANLKQINDKLRNTDSKEQQEKENKEKKNKNNENEEKKEIKDENDKKKGKNKISMLAFTNTMLCDKDLRLNGSVIQRAIHSIDDDNKTSDVNIFK